MIIIIMSVKDVKKSRKGLPFSLANPAAIPNVIDINIMPEMPKNIGAALESRVTIENYINSLKVISILPRMFGEST